MKVGVFSFVFPLFLGSQDPSLVPDIAPQCKCPLQQLFAEAGICLSPPLRLKGVFRTERIS